ncbi:MAG TPA: DNA polymerase III subunit alpha [Cyclobacteriaceae bacterium]|nr:DNA polymerase III subunit alpha [Cyclobacteriaceae bacterium]
MFLNCHTAFSFKYGTLQVEDLFNEAQRCGVKKLVLTEINNTASYIELLRLCKEKQPIDESGLNRFGKPGYALDIALGIEFRKEDNLLYVAIAKNNDGFEEMNRFLSYHNIRDIALPERAPEWKDVFVVYPFGKREPEQLRPNEYIGIRKHELSRIVLSPSVKRLQEKFVALHPVTFAKKRDFNVHRLLRAMHHNTLLSKLPEHLQAREDEVMMPERELELSFAGFPQLITNTKKILDACHIHFDLGADKNKRSFSGDLDADWEQLVTDAWSGFQQRYEAKNEKLRERFQRELNIIRGKNFCTYYLITYDLIKHARENGYDFVGRGSGANSMVAYCLGITNVDPIELDLYFERFLNPERTSPPDFDLDFSWDNRDAIYEYLFKKYGPDHICLLGTHVTYQSRSVLRELGKVFGLPKEEIDQIVDEPERHRSRDHITELIFRYASYIQDLPSNLSIHAGGVLITEKPIYAYTALHFPPKGYPVSHFEMNNAEDLGIFKFDILSQRGLGHLKETVRHVKRNKNIDVDIHRFHDFKRDEKIKTLLRNSSAIGCFYVESPAMRMLLGKLKCEDYLTLVAASSIIRPGVARSGMMRAYIERFHKVQKGEAYEPTHPKIDELMKETFGVMVYQEDVIKVAHHFAGMSLSEADVLRRSMSGKMRSRESFKKIEKKFFDNCAELGYAKEVIDRVWFEIESFAGYSFAKGHSASYAVESFQSLYLKAHYPLEFMVGVINNFGGFYSTEFYFHEARRSGGKINAPCINKSEHLTTIYGDEIFIGFIHLKSLESKVSEAIIADRERQGPFTGLDNFLNRVPTTSLEQVRILIRLGAFRFTGKSKQRLLWEAMLHLSSKAATKTRAQSTALFDTEPGEYPLPALQRQPLEDAFDEIELLGFPLCDPFLLLEQPCQGNTTAREMASSIGKAVLMVGYLVTTKNTRTLKGESMHFGTFYDHNGDFFDTVHFPAVARKFPFRGRGFYEMRGKVVEDFGVLSLEIDAMKKLPMISKRIEQTKEFVEMPREPRHPVH